MPKQFIHHLKEEFHKFRNLIFVVFVFCMAFVFSFLSTGNAHNTSAANTGDFRPGNIISDAVMSNYSSMSVTDIQNFLSSKNQCDNRNYDLYLQYTHNQPNIKWHWEGEPYNGHFVCMAEERFGDGEVIGSGMTAAEIIHDAAQRSRINPQALLVLLQKESSLITDKVPNDFDYRKATGYGCPDTAACDSKYYGFKNQVYRAAELFRHVLDHNSVYYPAGRNVYVGYHPNSSCGGTTVYIENRATAALYQYTPYQPNSSALNAGYGTGDVCSAYGNRNFYLYFTDWFGSTQAAVDGELVIIPDGEYNLISAVANNRSLGLAGSDAVLTSLDTSDRTQRWKFQRDSSTGYYQLINASTSQPLISQTVDPGLGNNVLAGRSTTCSKQWKIYRTSDDKLTFESACTSGIVLDVYGAYSAVGTNVQTYLTHGGNSQKWELAYARTIPDGVYAVQSALDNSKAFDVYGGYSANGTNVQLWNKHLETHQRWYLEYHDDEGGYYTFTSPALQKNLDLYSAVAASGQNLQIWTANNSCAQKWHIIPNGDSYNIISSCSAGYAIDLANHQAGSEQNVQLGEFTNQNSQRWQFIPIAPAIAEGTYIIQPAAADDKALDIYGGYTTEGTNVELFDYHGGAWQQWQFTYNPRTDDYKLYNAYSDKYLDLYGSYTRAGENVQIWPGNSSCGQRWRIQQIGTDKYTLKTSCDLYKSLDLYGGYLENRTNIQIWDSHDGIAQQWLLTEVK